MSEEQTIVINDEEHNVSELTVETQMHVARIAEIRQEIARLQMQINERQVVLNAYGEAVVNAVKSAGDEELEAEVVQQTMDVGSVSGSAQVSWKQIAVEKQERLRTGAEGEPVKEMVETIMSTLYTQKGNKIEATDLAPTRRVDTSV